MAAGTQMVLLALAPLKTLTITNVATTSDTVDLSTYTYTTVSIGAEPAAGERRFILVLANSSAGTGPATQSGSATIGGSNATNVTSGFQIDDQASVWMFWLEVPTGTTATIVIPYGQTQNGNAISVFRIISTGGADLSFGTVQASAANTISLTLDVPVWGVAVGGTASTNGTNELWTGLTKITGIDLLSNEWVTFAYGEFNAGSPSLSVTTNGNIAERVCSCVAIGPV